MREVTLFNIVEGQIVIMVAAALGIGIEKILTKGKCKIFTIYVCIIVGLYTAYNIYELISFLCQ